MRCKHESHTFSLKVAKGKGHKVFIQCTCFSLPKVASKIIVVSQKQNQDSKSHFSGQTTGQCYVSEKWFQKTDIGN